MSLLLHRVFAEALGLQDRCMEHYTLHSRPLTICMTYINANTTASKAGGLVGSACGVGR